MVWPSWSNRLKRDDPVVFLLKVADSSLLLALELMQPFPFWINETATGVSFPNSFAAFSKMNQLSGESNDGSSQADPDRCLWMATEGFY